MSTEDENVDHAVEVADVAVDYVESVADASEVEVADVSPATTDVSDEQSGSEPTEPPPEESRDIDVRLWSTAPRVKVSFNPFLPDPAKVFDPLRIYGLGTTQAGLDAFIDANQQAKVSDSVEFRNWGYAVDQATKATHVTGDGLSPAMERKSAMWTQTPMFNGVMLTPSIPRLSADSKGVENLTGERAIQKVTALLSPLGTTLNVPCWHTGIWVTLRTPTLAALVELDTRLATEKVLLGRATRGLIFSNESVAVNKHVAEFIFSHVIDSSFRPLDADQLQKVIKLPDLAVLANYMAATIYMRGFPYSFSCTVDLEKCRHVTKELLALTKLLWVDTATLTDKQLKQMASPTPKVKHTVADVEAYQNEWVVIPESVLAINDNVSFAFKLPTIDEHIQIGYRWVDDLVQSTEAAFGQSLTANERAEYLIAQARATTVRQYSHWIDKAILTYDDASGSPVQSFVTDEDTLSDLYAKFSSVPELADQITDGIIAYINARTMAVIAIPNEACPNCGKHHLSVDGPMGHLIPLDAVSTFFLMLRSHLAKNL